MEPDCLANYSRFDFDDGRWKRTVFRKGTGPGVIVIHEIPGLHPRVVEFADRLAEAGLTVYLPSLFGKPGHDITLLYTAQSFASAAFCVWKEFDVWASDRSSPIVDWLRALAHRVRDECGPRVGAVGMCISGNFALAMMTEPEVVAPVLSQPSLPLPLLPRNRAALGLSSDEIDCARRRLAEEDLTIIGLRFLGDPMVPEERFDTYKKTFGDRFEEIAIDAKEVRAAGLLPPHSVLTLRLRDDDPAGPTRRAERRVIEFFRERLGVAAPPAAVPPA
jgi:dienelactone hydrolase